jgi:hypothetical protein
MMTDHPEQVCGPLDLSDICRCGHHLEEHLPDSPQRKPVTGPVYSACQLEYCHCVAFHRLACDEEPSPLRHNPCA